MAVAAFDTLTVSKDLQHAGIQEKYAEAIALAVKQGQGDLVTKQDIALLKSEIDWVKWAAIGAILALSIGTIATIIGLMPSP